MCRRGKTEKGSFRLVSLCVLSALSKVLLPPPFGRHAEMLLHVAAEEREIGEIQLDADFLDALVMLFQQVLHVLHHVAVDEFGSGMSAGFFAHAGEIFGRDAELVGIVGHGAGLGAGGRKQIQELAEHLFAGGIGGGLENDKTLQCIAEVVEKSQQQGIDKLLLVAAGSACQLSVYQVIVLAKARRFLRAQLKDGRFFQKHKGIPRIAVADERQLSDVIP